MSAKWRFGTVDIFVSDEDTNREIKRAEIIALDSTVSSYHFFGAGSRHYSVKGLVIGNTNLAQLETWAINNTVQAFTTPWATETTAKLDKNVKATALKYGGGTFDGVTYTVETTPLYVVSLEVIPV